MSRHRQLSAEERAAIKLAARQRVEAVWACLDVSVSRSDAAGSERTRPEGVRPVPWGGAETASDSDFPGAGDKHCLGEHAMH